MVIREVYAVKAYRPSGGMAPLILNLGARWRSAVNILSPLKNPVPTGWAPEWVFAVW